ncbi:hypothetical protein JOC86_003766 [Bacillus pakistanensis]|uniref:Uncharacterized protein n=1 Tax=Rossellomorea pakistanensis TaxID=992288 RepID=A0ABS2NH99_9BACI|nr:hypothetical protein [Bacillus pakistanensis]
MAIVRFHGVKNHFPLHHFVFCWFSRYPRPLSVKSFRLLLVFTLFKTSFRYIISAIAGFHGIQDLFPIHHFSFWMFSWYPRPLSVTSFQFLLVFMLSKTSFRYIISVFVGFHGIQDLFSLHHFDFCWFSWYPRPLSVTSFQLLLVFMLSKTSLRYIISSFARFHAINDLFPYRHFGFYTFS